MSKIYFNNNDRNKFKEYLKSSVGLCNIELIKKNINYKSLLISYTNISKPLIDIIYEYTHDMISVLCKINEFDINIIVENQFDIMIIYYCDVFKIRFNSVSHDIIQYAELYDMSNNANILQSLTNNVMNIVQKFNYKYNNVINKVSVDINRFQYDGSDHKKIIQNYNINMFMPQYYFEYHKTNININKLLKKVQYAIKQYRLRMYDILANNITDNNRIFNDFGVCLNYYMKKKYGKKKYIDNKSSTPCIYETYKSMIIEISPYIDIGNYYVMHKINNHKKFKLLIIITKMFVDIIKNLHKKIDSL